MHLVFEFAFDLCYLVVIFTMGARLMREHRRMKTGKLFGAMALFLGVGDCFHLIPRMGNLLGFPPGDAVLGVGTLVTSITATVFYLLLHQAFRRYYGRDAAANVLVWVMAAARIVLCLLPQNNWFSPGEHLAWAVLRNIPFVGMGLTVAILFRKEEKKNSNSPFRWMSVGISISFVCYIPVVLLAGNIPAVGMLMIPKTLAYLWMLSMAFHREHRILQDNRQIL